MTTNDPKSIETANEILFDYKGLLSKYIKFIQCTEGTDFIDDFRRKEENKSVQFTDEEWAILTEEKI